MNIRDLLNAFVGGYAKECCMKAFGSFKKDVNAKIGVCSTPLHVLAEGLFTNPSAREGIPEAMRTLIEYGADPRFKYPSSIVTSAYDFAASKNLIEVVNLFDEGDLDIKEPDVY